MCLPVVLEGLVSELDQSVGLGAVEVEVCRGLMELLRAFRREFWAEPAMEAAEGPSRPAKEHGKAVRELRSMG